MPCPFRISVPPLGLSELMLTHLDFPLNCAFYSVIKPAFSSNQGAFFGGIMR